MAHRCHEACTGLNHLEFIGYRTEGFLDIQRQAFHLPRPAVVLPQHRLGFHHFHQRGEQFVLHRLHASRRELHDTGVPEAVDDAARKPIGFAIHQAVMRRGVVALPQGQRHLQTVDKERLAGMETRVSRKQPRTDERIGINSGVTNELVTTGTHLHRLARLERRERRRRHVHFIAEHPQVPRRQTTVLIAAQT